MNSAARRWAVVCAVGALWACFGCHSRSGSRTEASPSASSSSEPPILSADPELAAAERSALAKLSEFRTLLERADPAIQDVEVQAIVRDGSLIESVWLLEAHAVAGGYEGRVRYDPQVLKSVQRGQQLRVREADVRDWSYSERGKPHGGETRQVLARQRRRAELADALPKCAQQKFADGCAALGDGYASGRVGEVEPKIALDLYSQACAGGSSYGCNAAGWASLHGRGVAKDLPAAAAFFARGCVTGDEHPFACDSRGFALLSGLAGTQRDLPLALRLLQKSCARGLSPSCLLLELAKAKGLRNGPKLGRACDVNFAEQVSRCSNDDDPEGCFLAGSAFETGVCGVAKSRARAEEYLRGAAALGAVWPGSTPYDQGS